MCQYCSPLKGADPLDFDHFKNFEFRSFAAVNAAVAKASGGCTPICDHHKSMIENGTLVPEQESQQEDPDGIEDGCIDEDEDGT